MRIVIDARDIKATTGRYVERLLHYLQELDHDNHYFVLLNDLNDWQPTAKNFKTKLSGVKFFTFTEQFKLLRQIRRLKPDLVHFAMPQQPAFYRRPKVTTIHDLTVAHWRNVHPDDNRLIYEIKFWVFKWLIKRVAKTSRQLIVPSRYTKADVVKYTRTQPAKITVTYEGADDLAEAASTAYEPLVRRRFMMFVGRQARHKNIPRLMAAHQELLTKYPDLMLVLVGKIDPMAEANQRLAEQNDYKNILFTGFVSDEELAWIYQHAAAYVFPSLSEGFGLPGLEAMRYDCPVAASRATCLPEIYGPAAIYFDPTDSHDVADCLDKLLSNNALRHRLINNGRDRLQAFSWRTMAQQTLDIYHKAVSDD